MEQLIIFIIMLALGSLFGKKKEKPKPKKQPSQQQPTYTQTVQSDSSKRDSSRTNEAPQKSRSLKELSKGLFEDIQKEFRDLQQEAQEAEQPMKSQGPQTEIFYPQPKETVTHRERPAKPSSAPRPERQSGRGRLHSDPQRVVQENERILQEDLIPTSQQQVLQGIIYSEILGPPKAKR
ncbi:hypothetical protein [Sporosarcina obsidiansis]|uniref:hypothetical protein n=1 Tax=Sporosarcina obsidiansis TaxID=2660748 RepID=UPI00129BD185|nr:hypothetical protein [Sporosarcina obsidiansis]